MRENKMKKRRVRGAVGRRERMMEERSGTIKEEQGEGEEERRAGC